MFLGITFLGWIIIGIAYFPLLLVLALRRRRTGLRGTLILSGLALLPLGAAVGEALYIDWRFQKLCKVGGIQITKRVTTDGYFDGSTDWSNWPEEFLKTGFRYIEWKDRTTGSYRRITMEERRIHVDDIPQPTARYRSTRREPAHPTPVAHLILRKEDMVIDVETGEILGRRTIFYRYPAFVDRVWWQFFDLTPSMCPPTAGDIEKAVLIPTREEELDR